MKPRSWKPSVAHTTQYTPAQFALSSDSISFWGNLASSFLTGFILVRYGKSTLVIFSACVRSNTILPLLLMSVSQVASRSIRPRAISKSTKTTQRAAWFSRNRTTTSIIVLDWLVQPRFSRKSACSSRNTDLLQIIDLFSTFGIFIPYYTRLGRLPLVVWWSPLSSSWVRLAPHQSWWLTLQMTLRRYLHYSVPLPRQHLGACWNALFTFTANGLCRNAVMPLRHRL